MFHWTDNLFFGRCADGSVRVRKYTQSPVSWPQADVPPDEGACALDVQIPAAEWASIVCSVSYRGEDADRYQMAERFHVGPKPMTNSHPAAQATPSAQGTKA